MENVPHKIYDVRKYKNIKKREKKFTISSSILFIVSHIYRCKYVVFIFIIAPAQYEITMNQKAKKEGECEQSGENQSMTERNDGKIDCCLAAKIHIYI